MENIWLRPLIKSLRLFHKQIYQIIVPEGIIIACSLNEYPILKSRKIIWIVFKIESELDIFAGQNLKQALSLQWTLLRILFQSFFEIS